MKAKSNPKQITETKDQRPASSPKISSSPKVIQMNGFSSLRYNSLFTLIVENTKSF